MTNHGNGCRSRFLSRWLALGALAALGATALWAASAQAGKPSGGGGTGGGTIYFGYNGGTWTMNSDGSGKTLLPVGGVPSRALHGGQRWFLNIQGIPGEFYPNGLQRGEIFAVRGDGNAAFTRQLTLQADLQPLGDGQWMPGDAGISWIARRWNTGSSTVVGGGIYRASIVFDSDGNVVGLLDQPVAPTVSEALVQGDFQNDVVPNISNHSWAPDGVQCLYGERSTTAGQWGSVWIADLFGGKRFLVTAGGGCWSPTGDKIAYTGGEGIYTISPDGSAAKLIIRSPGQVGGAAAGAVWSPTGSHLIHIKRTGSIADSSVVQNIYRTTATGTGGTDLTGDIAGLADTSAWR